MQNEANWYVVQVISGTETNVKESLAQRRESFGMEDNILEVFIPNQEITSIRASGAKVKRNKNILPGYILVKMVVTNESWYIVRNTPNVTGFLGAGNIPVPVSPADFEKLKGKIEENKEVFSGRFKEGDIVTITKGAFEGNEGTIMEINEKKGTVKLNISLLGRDTPAEVPFGQVKVKK